MAEPISFTQGETVNFTVTITDSLGAPVDVSAVGITFDAEIRDVADLEAMLAQFTYVKQVAPNAHKVKFTLDTATSFGIPPNVSFSNKGILNTTPDAVYIYDVFMITAGPPITKRKVAGGLVSIAPAATRQV